MKISILIPIALLISSMSYASGPGHNRGKHHAGQSDSGHEIIDPSLWRGVNLPLALNPHKPNILSQADFDFAAQAGANVIRLSVHADEGDGQYVEFFDQSGNILPADKSPAIADLKTALLMAQNSHLKVIIDLHTTPGRRSTDIWTDPLYWDKVVNIWAAITVAFKNNPTVVAFDLMNEPNIINYIKKQNFISEDISEAKIYTGSWSPPESWKNTPRDYDLQITKVISAIRAIDNNRYVIVEGFGLFGNPINFSWMKPIGGFNKVIYSFHMYIPTELTNMGTNGSKKKGDESNATPFVMPQDGEKIDKAFAPVIAFQHKYNVPVFVGEFGITDDAVFNKDANGNPYNGACWLAAVVNKMNANKWGWAYWDFWANGIRKPKSVTDPRYIILSAAMKGKIVPDYCK